MAYLRTPKLNVQEEWYNKVLALAFGIYDKLFQMDYS